MNPAETTASTDISIVSDNTDIDSISEYGFEDYYLDSYLSGNNKTDSYRKACEATDYETPTYISQSAYAYHKRLDAKGLIQQALQRTVQSDQVASRLKLLSLMETAQSEQVQFSSAKHVSGTLYVADQASTGIEVHVNRDNVTIKHGKDTLTVEKDKDIKEIDG